jgi:hypothetical protein
VQIFLAIFCWAQRDSTKNPSEVRLDESMQRRIKIAVLSFQTIYISYRLVGPCTGTGVFVLIRVLGMNPIMTTAHP